MFNSVQTHTHTHTHTVMMIVVKLEFGNSDGIIEKIPSNSRTYLSE